jgi:predicted TIM-barrel fold metal-dependent hydrolase
VDPARLLFGSDWPVCTLAASYRSVVGLAPRQRAGQVRPSRKRCSSSARRVMAA